MSEEHEPVGPCYEEAYSSTEAATRAALWQTAIGLQDVDHLRASDYLQRCAARHIHGQATLETVASDMAAYYEQRAGRTPTELRQEEADKVAVNITQLLSTKTLAFSAFGFLQVHKHLFAGIFDHAGELRPYDISKKEWVLRGRSVTYMYSADLLPALEHDLEQERRFDYALLNNEQKVQHIARFVADLWQIHPFREGNTRTTAVFTIQYLRSLGFAVDNTPFARHSWYFRNALVRYLYKDCQGVSAEPLFLERFLANVLLGTSHELRNRELIIPAKFESKV